MQQVNITLTGKGLTPMGNRLTLIGKGLTLTDKGLQNQQELNIQISIVARVDIDAKTAQRKVTAWLVSEVGNMLMGGLPQLIISQQTVWRVPVILTASSQGEIGQVGHVDVNTQTGLLEIAPHLQTELLNNVTLLSRSTPTPIS